MRRGEGDHPPDFDLIGASGDRIFAKASGRDDLYIPVVDHPYVHRIPDKGWIELPQSFLKLDPEVGMASARVEDLQAHVTINDDDERHPATERFGLFRGLVGSTSQRFTQLR